MRITALSLLAIVIVAAVPSIARERDQCYESCNARCAAKRFSMGAVR